jgi:CRP/FNR family transcriptional regulator
MDTFKQFISHYPQQPFKKGETILLKGERPKGVYILESGLIKTYSITKTGDERLVSIGRKDEDFPIGFAFGLIEESQYFYDAFTKCTVRLVPREAFIRHLQADPRSMYMRQVRTTMLLLSTLSRIHALEQSKASDKVALTLLYMANQLGGIFKSYKFANQLKISVTQQEIADSLGLTRETTNIELKKLEMLKLIAHSRKTYVLHMERLRKYLDQR